LHIKRQAAQTGIADEFAARGSQNIGRYRHPIATIIATWSEHAFHLRQA
jgi:hypothetical protein